MSEYESKTPRAAWEGLSPEARRRVIIQAVVSVLLVVLAFRSLSKQSEASLRGPKPLWKVVIPASMITLKGGNAWVLVPIGSVLYFAAGRRWRQAH
jgi:hypothetical protein